MSLAQCIDMVAKGDPDRHAVTRAATDDAQARLYPLYALNLEIARAAWASAEPLVCEMRLQWWADAVTALGQGATVPAHPVLESCGHLAGDAVAGALLADLVEARRWDIWTDGFADETAFWAHLEATGGAVMQLAVRALGADAAAQRIARDHGTACVLAPWFQAVPELTARGRTPLPDPSPQAVSDLARAALDRIRAARTRRRAVPAPALAALLAGWQAPGLLRLASREPTRVAEGRLWRSDFARRGTLAFRALTGRW